MLELDEAIARCLAAAPAMVEETCPLAGCHGRVLARDLVAPRPLPPWDNSAMDGFAVVAADTRGEDAPGCDDHEMGVATSPAGWTELQVLETIAAGSVGTRTIKPGTASRIMTGAPVPPGADAIVIRENTEPIPGAPGRVRVAGSVQPGQHIRRAGEELAVGDPVLPAGTPLGPAQLGLCASLGIEQLPVARPPRVGIIATGDEIVLPGLPLGPGQIHASNSAALVAWVREAGGEPWDCGIARDDLDSTHQAFKRALDAECDLILSTGGVSVGDFDVVREAMGAVGAEMDFWKVRMKPGKPLAFGTIGGRPAFGLPGNPVSCQVGFLQFVRPVIRRALGVRSPFLPVLPAHLVEDHHKKPGRTELVRVRLAFTWTAQGLQLQATRTGPQGSHRSTTLARGHGLVRLDADSHGARAGERVPVQVYDWSFAAGGQAWA